MRNRLASALVLGTTLAVSGAALANPTPAPAPGHSQKEKSKAKPKHHADQHHAAQPSKPSK
jgi:hypothetical protein